MCSFLQGFIRICCCKSCVVEYHITCWKAYKMSSFCEKNEKVHFELHLYLQACLLSPCLQCKCSLTVISMSQDFLQGPCLTPDCIGQICSMEIFDQTGLVKVRWFSAGDVRRWACACSRAEVFFFLQFKETIPKAVKPKKPKLSQKCTRLKKLKSKEEHLIKGKRHKQACQETEVTNSEVLQQKEDSACQSQEKGKKTFSVFLSCHQMGRMVNMVFFSDEWPFQHGYCTGIEFFCRSARTWSCLERGSPTTLPHLPVLWSRGLNWTW